LRQEKQWKKGRHVFIEKPIQYLEEAEELLFLEKKHGVKGQLVMWNVLLTRFFRCKGINIQNPCLFETHPIAGLIRVEPMCRCFRFN